MNEAKLGWGGARKVAGAKPAGYVPPPERIEYEAERARNEKAKADLNELDLAVRRALTFCAPRCRRPRPPRSPR